MRTLWNNDAASKHERENLIYKIGKLFESNKFNKLDLETRHAIRKETGLGLMDAGILLKMYLKENGYFVDENDNIIKQAQTE